MKRSVRTNDLRVCGTCWSVVHPDDLLLHDRWHDRVRTEAIAEASRRLAATVAQPAV
jgi:hypothetical protein